MNYSEMPLVAGQLSLRHKEILLMRLDDLLHFLNAPGDWGYQSKLGVMTNTLHALYQEVRDAPVKES